MFTPDPTCYWCGDEAGEVIMVGGRDGGKPFHAACWPVAISSVAGWDMSSCDVCPPGDCPTGGCE